MLVVRFSFSFYYSFHDDRNLSSPVYLIIILSLILFPTPSPVTTRSRFSF